jgi:hypothetical protein
MGVVEPVISPGEDLRNPLRYAVRLLRPLWSARLDRMLVSNGSSWIEPSVMITVLMPDSPSKERDLTAGL